MGHKVIHMRYITFIINNTSFKNDCENACFIGVKSISCLIFNSSMHMGEYLG